MSPLLHGLLGALGGLGWAGCQVHICYACHTADQNDGPFEGVGSSEVAGSSEPGFFRLSKGSELDIWLKD
jgi:hypothetical protein